MTRRDRELLQKQFSWLTPKPRHNGVLILAIVGMFTAAMAFGAVSGPEHKPASGSPSYLLR